MKEKLTQIVATYVQNGVLVIPSKPMELTNMFRTRTWTEEIRPNIHKVVTFFGIIVDELRASGKAKEARELLGIVSAYVIDVTQKYAKGEYDWEKYASIFDAGSPCCMCDEQTALSDIASRNGFGEWARYIVSIHCPVSPRDYRREASTWTLTEERWKVQHARNAEFLTKWDGPIFDFFWEQSHTRNR